MNPSVVKDTPPKILIKCFCVLVVIFPLMNRYQSPVSGQITLSEFFLILFLIIAFLFGNVARRRLLISACVVSCYLFLHLFVDFSFLSDSELQDSVGTGLRLLLLYVSLALLVQDFFDRKFATRLLMRAAVLVALYGIVQVVASFFGMTLSTYIPFLPIMGDVNLDTEVAAKMDEGFRFRCQSILNEPAALCCYLTLPLILAMFSKDVHTKNRNPQYALIVLFSAVCLISASSTGIIVVCILWILFAVLQRDKKSILGIKIRKLFIIVAFIVMAIVLSVETGLLQYFIDRTFAGGLESSTRFYAIGEMFGTSDSIITVLLGAGLQETMDYLPGFARVYYCLGLVGLIVFMYLLISLYFHRDGAGKIILFIFFILNIGTEIILGNFVFYYLPFIVGSNALLERNAGKNLSVKKEN